MARLDSAAACRLFLLLVASQASGSVLLRRWVATHDLSPAWVRLGVEDNQPGHFLASLCGALWPQRPWFEDQLAPKVGLEEGWAALINHAVDLQHDRLLILERYQMIEAAPIHEGLATLIDYLPPRLHVLIATVAEPPLPLPRWRVRRQLQVLRLPAVKRTQPKRPLPLTYRAE